MSCAEGDTGFVYEGARRFDVERVDLSVLRRPATKIMMNVGNPGEAFALSFIPNDGVGLARIEFIISNGNWRAPDGAGALCAADRSGARRRRSHHVRVPGQDGILRRQARRGGRHARGRVLSEGRHRPTQRLQDERVRAARRRRGIRAG